MSKYEIKIMAKEEASEYIDKRARRTSYVDLYKTLDVLEPGKAIVLTCDDATVAKRIVAAVYKKTNAAYYIRRNVNIVVIGKN